MGTDKIVIGKYAENYRENRLPQTLTTPRNERIMTRLRTCPTCGSRALRSVHGSVVFRVKRRHMTVPDLDYLQCDVCGEQLFDAEANRKIDAFSASQLHRPSRRKSA